MSLPTRETRALFHEEQRFRQPWLWALLVFICLVEIGLFGYGMVQQLVFGRPWGTNPMPDALLIVTGGAAILFSLGLLLLFLAMRLVTEVREGEMRLRFFPLHLREIVFRPEELQRWEAVTYRPLRDYGGWGIRYGRQGKAYNVSGSRGVRLEFRDGRHILVGSQRPEDLATALDRITRR